jgi:protein tyrosine phosphatase (PTP) superfamily phosphohydrolase (DUF442 family)
VTSANEESVIAAKSSGVSRVPSRRLPNLIKFNDAVYSGGTPDGPLGFDELRSLGIKTVISVEAIPPDAEKARAKGLRYVHLPHGYDGISPTRRLQLSKAVATLDGPIYIHCHHGIHRSPAATAMVCVSLGWLNSEQGLATLRFAGTSSRYRGLYQSVRDADLLNEEELRDAATEFVERIEVPPMTEKMVFLESLLASLEEQSKSGWELPGKDPDKTAEYQALLLKEHYREWLREGVSENSVRESNTDVFRRLVEDAEENARRLEKALGTIRSPPSEISGRFEHVKNDCVECHRRFRDLPHRTR